MLLDWHKTFNFKFCHLCVYLNSKNIKGWAWAWKEKLKGLGTLVTTM